MSSLADTSSDPSYKALRSRKIPAGAPRHCLRSAQATPSCWLCPRTDAAFGSFADEVVEILDRCGIDVFTAKPGDPYQSDRHKPLAVMPTSDPDLNNTVAEAFAAGFYDRAANRVRRQAQARFYQYRSGGEGRHDRLWN